MQSERQSEEAALIARARLGESSAMEALILPHQPLVFSLARRFFCENITREELVQAGNLGLMQAVYRFDAQQHVKLITYAVPWILGEMRKAVGRAEQACLSLEEARTEGQASLAETLQGSAGISIAQLDLRLAVQRLPQQEQLLICLRYYRDRTQKEAAQLMGKSQTQISRIERRALDHLHAYLA